MARSLVTEPDILVSDEALSNLDAQTRNYLQDEILRIWQDTGSTIVFVTHNVDEAVYTSDRIIVMSNIPSKIIAKFHVDLDRPRNRTSHESLDYRARVLEILRVEQEKALERLRPQGSQSESVS
jgi:ABC-type nitrate/sulfonate/bicarbonate transport system ATPase subunit